MTEEEFKNKFIDENGNFNEVEFAKEINNQVDNLCEMYAENSNVAKHRQNMREALEERHARSRGEREVQIKHHIPRMKNEPEHIYNARVERTRAHENASNALRGTFERIGAIRGLE